MPTSRLRKIAVRALGLVLVLGLAAWLARDLPRRGVEAALAKQLAASVHLGRLEIEDSEHFRLLDLEIENLRDYPFVERLGIEELWIVGKPRQILDVRFERIRLRGVEVRLAPAPRVEPPDRPLPVIGELILEPASIHVAVGEGRQDLRLRVEATVFDVGEEARGEVLTNATELTFAPFFRLVDPETAPPLAGRLADLEAVLRLGPAEPGLSVDVSRASLTFGGDSLEIVEPRLRAQIQEASIDLELSAKRVDNLAAPLDNPHIAATITPLDDAGEVLRFELRPTFAGFDTAALEAEWDVEHSRLRRLEGTVRGLDLTRLLPNSGFDATLDADFGNVEERFRYSATLAPRRLEVGPGRYLAPGKGSTVRIQGDLPYAPLRVFQLPAWSGSIEVEARLPTCDGRWVDWRLPAALFPMTATFAGRLEDAPAGLSLRGATRVGSGAGSLAANGEVALRDGTNELSWSWRGGDLGQLPDLLRAAGLSEPPLKPRGAFEASGTLHGAWARPMLAGALRLDGIQVAEPASSDPPRSLDRGEATATWSWNGGDRVRIRAIEVDGWLTVPPLEPLGVNLSARGQAATDLSDGRLSEMIFSLPDLGQAHGAGEWRDDDDGLLAANATVTLGGLELGRWRELLKPVLGSTIPADLTLGGSLGADLEVSVDGDRSWQLTGPMRLEAAGFASDDGSRVVEGLTGQWQLTAHGAPGAPVEIDAGGTAGGFLLLWNTFFADFSDVEAELSATGQLDPAPPDGTRAWRITGRGTVPDGPVIEATLEDSRESDAWRYALTLEDGDLAATHEHYLANLLEERLGRLGLGGVLSANVRGSYRRPTEKSPAAWSLQGSLGLEGFRLESGGGQAVVTGLGLDLPLDLRRRPTAELAFTGPSLAGRLAFERLAVRGLELPGTDTDLLIQADAVGLEKPINLEILGGSLTFERLTLKDLLRPERHLETGVRITDLQLEKIAQAMELFPLEGALSGYLPRATLSPDRLHVEGGGEVEVFGGTVRLRDISGENVLTRFPKLTVSADFEEIDLGRLTRRIDFGEMTGVLQGSLEDCELFRGVPVRFSAHLQTVEREGVRRTVDVKAINNITILGTGQGTNIFDRGLQRFFQKYTYSALGVDMHLDDDVLLLRGLEERGGKELFLRGRLPFRIDVVNAQPGKTVSFQAMVRRLQSLDFDTASSEPPVLD